MSRHGRGPWLALAGPPPWPWGQRLALVVAGHCPLGIAALHVRLSESPMASPSNMSPPGLLPSSRSLMMLVPTWMYPWGVEVMMAS